MQQRRVLGVRADGFGPGSGYLVAERLLVTGAHVVGAVGSPVRVFRPAAQPVFDGRVVWRGTPGGRDDAALLAIDDARWVPADDAPVRWGRTVTFTPRLSCQTWGVPDAVQAPGNGIGSGFGIEVAQPSGTLSPGEGLVADRYVVDLEGAAPAETDP